MTLRAGHYRAIQLFYDDGSPVIGPGGREVWVARCGAGLLGTRTDGGDPKKNIATFLGIRRKTVAPSGPLTPVTVPGGVGTPGSGFEPGQGQIQGDGGGGLLTVGGGKLIVPEDKEVWVVKPCTRTPGPPLGPFPLGNHVATPLGVELDGKAVYADGCVECGDSCYPHGSMPSRIRVILTARPGCSCPLPAETVMAKTARLPWEYLPEQTLPGICNLFGSHRMGLTCDDVGAPTVTFGYATTYQNPFTRERHLQVNYSGGVMKARKCFFQQPVIPGTVSYSPFFFQATGATIYDVDPFNPNNCFDMCVGLVDITIVEET